MFHFCWTTVVFEWTCQCVFVLKVCRSLWLSHLGKSEVVLCIWCPALFFFFRNIFLHLAHKGFQIELFLPLVLSAEWLTAPGMSREKLDGRRTDTHTVDTLIYSKGRWCKQFNSLTCWLKVLLHKVKTLCGSTLSVTCSYGALQSVQ